MTFDEVYARFRQPIWRLARRLTDSDDEALDATQEIFLRIWRGLGGFRGEAKLSTWVFQIAWNYLRAFRRQKGRGLRIVNHGDPDSNGPLDSARDPRPDPERRVASANMVERVEAALRELPEHFRVIVWLRDGEGMSYQEMSAVLDVPIGTVRSRLARARAALREIVENR